MEKHSRALKELVDSNENYVDMELFEEKIKYTSRKINATDHL